MIESGAGGWPALPLAGGAFCEMNSQYSQFRVSGVPYRVKDVDLGV